MTVKCQSASEDVNAKYVMDVLNFRGYFIDLFSKAQVSIHGQSVAFQYLFGSAKIQSIPLQLYLLQEFQSFQFARTPFRTLILVLKILLFSTSSGQKSP